MDRWQQRLGIRAMAAMLCACRAASEPPQTGASDDPIASTPNDVERGDVDAPERAVAWTPASDAIELPVEYERCSDAEPPCGGHIVELDAGTVSTVVYRGARWSLRRSGHPPASVTVRFVPLAARGRLDSLPSGTSHAFEPRPKWLPERLELPSVRWLGSVVAHRGKLYAVGTLRRRPNGPQLLEIDADGSVRSVAVPHRRVFDVAPGDDALILSLTREGGESSIAEFDPVRAALTAEVEVPKESELAAECGPATIFNLGLIVDVDGTRVYTSFDCVPDH